LVLGIIGLTVIFSGYFFLTAKPTYEGEVRFIVRQQPTADNSNYVVFTFDRYYNWFGSEFLVDDYTQIVDSDAFAQSILGIMQYRLTLGKPRGTLTTADIKGALEVDRRQRELRVKVTASSREETKELADTVAMILTDAKLKPIKGSMVDDKAVFTQIDEATPDEIQSTRTKELINTIVRIAIGLAAALALAFLLEYLDSSIRDEKDAQRVLEMPVLGTIPRG